MIEDFAIEWITDAVGVIHDSQMCTRKTHWQIKLSNGKATEVATVQFTINPFPSRGEPHYSGGERFTVSRPGIKLDSEERAYAEALILAGRWLESETLKAKLSHL